MTYYTSSQHSVKPQPCPSQYMMKGTNYEAHASSSNFSPMISSLLSPAILLSTMGSYTLASDFHIVELKNLTIMQNVQ